MMRRALASMLLLAGACSPRGGGIPTYRVEPSHFSRRITAEGNLAAVKATPLSAPMEAPGALKVAWIAEDGTRLRKNDVVVRFDPTDFQRQRLEGGEARQTVVNKLTRTSSDASTTRTNLQRDAEQARAELELARRFNFDDAEIFSRYQRIEAEADQHLATDRRSHAENLIGVRDKLSKTDRDLIDIEDRKAGLTIRNAELGLRALQVIAPHDGILVLQRDWRGDVLRIGASAWPGMTIGQLPDLSEMKADVFVLEADAAGLAVGEKATVTLESNPAVTYSGKITRLDKMARPRMRGVPVQYFGVTVSLDRTDARVMKPGARIRAVLDVESRDGAFAIPRQALFEKEGKKLVYRKRGQRFEPAVVTMSSATAGRVVITSGVKKDDELALIDPTNSERRGEPK
jgi:multidrug efflux pump subunit AcrA (membrane-fusion protein)